VRNTRARFLFVRPDAFKLAAAGGRQTMELPVPAR